ncbi:GGDEF domain-containing protein [Alkalimarinus coralli]|uniref:GGDEF domain-containing protein n=1 Tax=Alkalimarinus coralli TaxID=2935863 RepID=UPI00202BA2B3|nr:GGDEF domain-containing protein [Alkalimarinus coralli]
MHHQVLNSVIKLTSHNDLEALDNCLVEIVADLVPTEKIELIHFYFDKERKTIANTLQIVFSPNNNIHTCGFLKDSDISVAILGCVTANFPVLAPLSDKQWHFILPIKVNNKVEGCISLTSAIDLNSHREIIEGMIQIYANHLRVINESERDELTDLLNRKSFNKRIGRLLDVQRNEQIRRSKEKQSLKRRKPISHDKSAWLALIDIDHFKQVNDTYGHVYGDEVLLMLSRKIKENFRHSDLPFRFGGEEFVIVLEPISAQDAAMVMERFRKEIEEFQFPRVGKITISIGYSKLGVEDFPPHVIEQADKALYYAKENGRNRVFRYETLIENGALSSTNSDSSIELF